MSSRHWALEMGNYNQWQNLNLYKICDELGEEERTRDRGMFFHTIHHTLDHILMVEVRLLEFVVSGQPPTAPFEPEILVHSDFAQLQQARQTFDESLLATFNEAADNWLDETISFFSQQHSRTRSMPRQFYLMQLFNHATHHRAQITAELHKLGVDYGSTDLPVNPQSLY